MIFSDCILEKGGIFLRNLNVNAANTAKDVWSSASSSYGMYSVPYECLLGLNNWYYVRYTYKFTTTNQSPTWVLFYCQGGNATFGSTSQINNPTSGTEYTASVVGQINVTLAMITVSSGTIYNGNYNAISGISSLVKNVIVYDITELFEILRAAGIVTTTAALKTWCDNNLDYSPRYTNYDITSLISDAVEKIHINKGNIVGTHYVETDGMDFYATSATIRLHKYFDTGSALSVYNNKGGGTVVHTRVDAATQNSPFAGLHPYVLLITTNGTASPGAGGFVCSHTAAANRIVVEKFVAKVPVGYNVSLAYNSLGTGASVTFLSPRAGTGNWEEYTILYKCGSEGSFSNGGHVYITGSNNTSVTWYVAYCMSCIITDDENLKNYTVLGNIDRIKNGYLFSRKFDNLNLLPDGNGARLIASIIPSTWSYDTTDVAGDAVASIVQPVNAGAGTIGIPLYVRTAQRYKLSMWIKCKQDMSSFLTAIRIWIGNTEVTHGSVVYRNGTRTLLTAALNPGDTTITVKNNANWADISYGGLGFRSNGNIAWNDLGAWNPNGSTGVISGITGSTIINLKTAYTGTAKAVNLWIVEKYEGSTYPYPISKSQLPTDNTWKYVEGYFGSNNVWDGRSNSGWSGLPSGTTYIQLYLNIYTNNGSVPIKYSDIRIEPITAGHNARYENKILIIGGN